MKEASTKRIGNAMAAVLILIAGIADLLSLIPFVGDFVGPIYWVCVSIYLWKIGMGFVNPRRIITEVASTLVELIPVLQWFPSILLGTGIVIALTRFEDKTGISATSLTKGNIGAALNHAGTRQPTGNTAPLNADGVRAPNGGLVK
jgi:hypothetical protein